jgi:hypothetical protein
VGRGELKNIEDVRIYGQFRYGDCHINSASLQNGYHSKTGEQYEYSNGINPESCP